MERVIEPVDIVRDVSKRLDLGGLGYMLTGSMAMNYYAEPRMTRDIDFVIELQGVAAGRIDALFASDYYVPEAAVKDALAASSSFNLIHNEGLIKVDCFARKPAEHAQVEFQRRQRVEIADFATWIVSPEDLMLAKLQWCRDTHSEAQLRDIHNLSAVPHDGLYLAEWIARLNLQSIWLEVPR